MLRSFTKTKVRERRQQGSVALAVSVNRCRARPLFVFCRTCLLVERLPRTRRRAGLFRCITEKWTMICGEEAQIGHTVTLKVGLWICVCRSVCLYTWIHLFRPPLSSAGSDYSSDQYSLRPRQPLTWPSNQIEVSPQWDWSSAPAAVSDEDEHEPAQELRCSILPMSLKRALRYGTLACSRRCIPTYDFSLRKLKSVVSKSLFALDRIALASTSGSLN